MSWNKGKRKMGWSSETGMSTSNMFVRGKDKASLIAKKLVNFFKIGRRVEVDRESLHHVPLAVTMIPFTKRIRWRNNGITINCAGGIFVVRRRVSHVFAREQRGGASERPFWHLRCQNYARGAVAKIGIPRSSIVVKVDYAQMPSRVKILLHQ